MPHTLASLVQKVRPSIVRIFVHDDDVGNPVAGTGFFIDPHTILTCAHTVLLTTNIKNLLESLEDSPHPEAALKKYYQENVRKVEITKDDGSVEQVTSVHFNGASDVAILSVASAHPFLSPSAEKITEGSDVFYCGYPKDFQMQKPEWPFSVLRGIVSSHVRAQVGGYAENNLWQLQMPMLGGASGAPLFSLQDGGLVGFMNGYRSWGTDGLMRKDTEDEEAFMDSLYVPLGLAIATPITDALAVAKTLMSN